MKEHRIIEITLIDPNQFVANHICSLLPNTELRSWNPDGSPFPLLLSVIPFIPLERFYLLQTGPTAPNQTLGTPRNVLHRDRSCLRLRCKDWILADLAHSLLDHGVQNDTAGNLSGLMVALIMHICCYDGCGGLGLSYRIMLSMIWPRITLPIVALIWKLGGIFLPSSGCSLALGGWSIQSRRGQSWSIPDSRCGNRRFSGGLRLHSWWVVALRHSLFALTSRASLLILCAWLKSSLLRCVWWGWGYPGHCFGPLWNGVGMMKYWD